MKEIIRKHKLLYVIIGIIGILMSFTNIFLAYILKEILDNISTGNFSKIKYFLLLVLLFAIVMSLVQTLVGYFGGKLQNKILHEAKSKVYENLNKMPIYTYQKEGMSFYYNMLTHDIEEIGDNYVQPSYDNIINIFMFAISLIALFRIHVIMAISFIALTLIVIFVPSLFASIQTNARNNYSKSSESFINRLENILSGFESIKLLNINDEIFQKTKKDDQEFEDKRAKMFLVDNFALGSIASISLSVQVLCMLVGSYFIIKGEITIGSLMMAVQILNFVFNPISTYAKNKNLMKSTENLRKKLDKYLEIKDTKGKEYDIKDSDIKLNDVSMTLSDKEIFKDFNYTFENGKSYIVIGESGSGKSTLAKLIVGYYDNFSGDILYGDINYKDINKNSIAKSIRYIGSDTYVIDDNVIENIRMYRDFTDEEVIKVAKSVGIDDNLINKKSIGHMGKFVSAGEYKRIAIARALIEKPYCIILDEPTANLDSENTAKMQEVIRNLDVSLKIVISHKYDDNYLKTFDEVVNINEYK